MTFTYNIPCCLIKGQYRCFAHKAELFATVPVVCQSFIRRNFGVRWKNLVLYVRDCDGIDNVNLFGALSPKMWRRKKDTKRFVLTAVAGRDVQLYQPPFGWCNVHERLALIVRELGTGMHVLQFWIKRIE